MNSPRDTPHPSTYLLLGRKLEADSTIRGQIPYESASIFSSR